MKVLLTAIGSAGDVNPFIAVGQALCQRGHRATLLVNPHFRHQVVNAGLDFLPLGQEAQLERVKRENTRFMLHPSRAHQHLWRELMLPNAALLVEALEAVVRADPPDVVVCHPVSFGARWVCERHGIQCAVAAPSPLVWMSRKDGSVHARAFAQEPPPEWLLGVQLRLARPWFRWTMDPGLNAVRKRFGLPPARDIFFDQIFGCDINLGLWSSVFRGPMADDPSNGRICGFTWFDGGPLVGRADERDEIARFLDQGEPPIVFTLGTTVVSVARNFYEHAAQACERLGRRGLLLTGAAERAPRRLPRGVRAFGYAAFSTVLPRGCATVHHGGIGTTAQALRSGKPTVVIPHAYDQFDNAARVKRLGVSTTLQRTQVSPSMLAKVLRQALEAPRMLERARQLGDQLAREDGAATAAEILKQIADDQPATAAGR
jgi:rhamnosyltransferase subunit B